MEYEYRFQVRLHDTDHAGVVFFAHLFTHAHDAYEAFMASVGLGLGALIADGVRLPVAHADADYLLPLHHGEEVAVTLAIAELGRTSFTVAYEFRCDGELRARLRTVHVFLDTQSGRPADLPQDMRAQLGPFGLEDD
ncbi:1,4-dihydroxy-2-naphthoyl-CoA hydrolase [Sulfurimicrobium lacus]|uniref:1,4-dihydroxy-2-naphthoyl-CoA hydrolase n=2 Tax=Sulfurimicrobium lacus TaxID=2715678 RepID=A0A6F8VBB0_9PROT|nr:1,4-dihydroxy-2-naphthoyl-CoA hydrolase [Sulfurimicrobium lacus]